MTKTRTCPSDGTVLLSMRATEPADWAMSRLFPSPAARLRQWLNPVCLSFPTWRSEVTLTPASYMHPRDEALGTAPTRPVVSPAQASVLTAADPEPAAPEGAEHPQEFPAGAETLQRGPGRDARVLLGSPTRHQPPRILQSPESS